MLRIFFGALEAKILSMLRKCSENGAQKMLRIAQNPLFYSVFEKSSAQKMLRIFFEHLRPKFWAVLRNSAQKDAQT